MIEKTNNYAYQLTELSRSLATSLEGIIIDEENSILWSEQDLEELGFVPVWLDEEQLKITFDYDNFFYNIMFKLGWLLSAIFVFCYRWILKLGRLIPSNKIKSWCAKKQENDLIFEFTKNIGYSRFPLAEAYRGVGEELQENEKEST